MKNLRAHGVGIKIFTGDNETVTQSICQKVGLPTDSLLLGEDIDAMDDHRLLARAEHTTIFAKLSPEQKARLVSLLRQKGHVVGFLGDGINDAAALKAADIGLAVDSGSDIAKESADIILLEKDLGVLESGILEGRKTYINMLKYIKLTIASNFGNMFSVLLAAALLPFLPMQSLQLILLNLIYDLCCGTIPWDGVDGSAIVHPRSWNADGMVPFMAFFGPASSIFDILTFLFLYFVLCPLSISHGLSYHALVTAFHGAALAQMREQYSALFQSGWMVESMWTQCLFIHLIRSEKMPFIQSRAAHPLIISTLMGSLLITFLPYTPLAAALHLAPLPAPFFLYLLPCLLAYIGLTTALKKIYIRRYGALL